jgi:hypothetical protein
MVYLIKFYFGNTIEKNKKLGKNSILIFFSLQMIVIFFFHSILFIIQNDHLIEQTYFLNDSKAFNIEGYQGYGLLEYYQFSQPYPRSVLALS